MPVDFHEKLTFSGSSAAKSTLLNVAYFVLQKIYHDLKIKDLFEKIQCSSKVTFDCDTINRFLSFARISDPHSKLGTFDQLESYYEKPSFSY